MNSEDFTNWRRCVASDTRLRLRDGEFVNFLGSSIATLNQTFGDNPDAYALIGYRHKTYGGRIRYNLYAFRGDSRWPEYVGVQLRVLLDKVTPRGMKAELLACGAISVQPDADQEYIVISVDGVECARVVVRGEDDYEVLSDILTEDALDSVEYTLWRQQDGADDD